MMHHGKRDIVNFELQQKRERRKGDGKHDTNIKGRFYMRWKVIQRVIMAKGRWHETIFMENGGLHTME